MTHCVCVLKRENVCVCLTQCVSAVFMQYDDEILHFFFFKLFSETLSSCIVVFCGQVQLS